MYRTRMVLQSNAVYVKKLSIKCQHCGYEWLSETKVSPDTIKKRVCCSKCRSSITVTFSNESIVDLKQQERPSLHPETLVWLDKAWTAAREKNVMFLDQLFNNPNLTRAQKLHKYAEHFRESANDRIYDDIPNAKAETLRRADYYDKLASSPTVNNEPNPFYDVSTNTLRNIGIYKKKNEKEVRRSARTTHPNQEQSTHRHNQSNHHRRGSGANRNAY